MDKRPLELLAPAANAEIAIQAILHGADAVYIGASSHGARKSASNSIEDIKRVVDFAHQFRAKVYVTVNTIIYERELKQVEALCRDLYRIGVDALIVQDMAVLRLDIPPIALHASTQCDIRTPEKAKFLEEVGFSQLVLARELTLAEIRKITSAVTIPVECFIHGALCVSYSGRCHASCAATGRSANRGECAQLCRLPYTLKDATGEIIAKDKYLLSLKDFNTSNLLPELIEAGVSSFKIEGRLKELDYVKNNVSFYDRILNRFIKDNENYCRSSFGTSIQSFNPDPVKSFNRGFSNYFLGSRRPENIASLNTPKSLGEIITDIKTLNNGDGISFFDKNGEYQGVNINKISNGKIITGRKVDIPGNAEIHRTNDVNWRKEMQKQSAERKIALDINIDNSGVTGTDEKGVEARIPLDVTREKARNPMDFEGEFARLGNTIYTLGSFHCSLPNDLFIPRSELSALRRELIKLLDIANLSTYRFDLRRKEDIAYPYPEKTIDYKDNVANSLAEKFYKDHGVSSIEKALELYKGKVPTGTVVMTTRHCILRELGMCKKNRDNKQSAKGYSNNKNHPLSEPLTISNGKNNYSLYFDCNKCEMQVKTL